MKIRRIDFYPDDWLTGTTELRDDERGVYITICALIYARSGPITFDLLKASSLSHGLVLNRCIRRLKELGKISEKDGRITQERSEKELRRSLERVEKASENGAKGNKIRWHGVATRSDAAIANNQQSTINNQKSDFLENGKEGERVIPSAESLALLQRRREEMRRDGFNFLESQ